METKEVYNIVSNYIKDFNLPDLGEEIIKAFIGSYKGEIGFISIDSSFLSRPDILEIEPIIEDTLGDIKTEYFYNIRDYYIREGNLSISIYNEEKEKGFILYKIVAND